MTKQTLVDWQPSCRLNALKARAEMYSQIRAFFVERKVLEVETPIIGRSTASDPLLASMQIKPPGDADATPHFLQTSPEYAMKRLVAEFKQSIFQICKTFRASESGSRHNPEFSMLEWYRPGLSLHELMNETCDLIRATTDIDNVEAYTYRDVFLKYVGLDPHSCSITELKSAASAHASYQLSSDHSSSDQSPSKNENEEDLRDELLDVLMAVCIEPHLGFSDEGQHAMITVISAYPASQASLARLRKDEYGNDVADRFELYIKGLEIANAYHELTDAKEQRIRFEQDNEQRAKLGLDQIPLDEKLLSALEAGLPDCSGIALGLDRLLMVRLNTSLIDDVLSFPERLI